RTVGGAISFAREHAKTPTSAKITAPCQIGSFLGFSSLVAPVLPQHLQLPCSRCFRSHPPMPRRTKSNQQQPYRSSSTRTTARFIRDSPDELGSGANCSDFLDCLEVPTRDKGDFRHSRLLHGVRGSVWPFCVAFGRTPRVGCR